MTVLLVDANNVAMRAVHAMSRSGLTNDQGVATGPLLNFINTLARHIKDEQPRALAVCWDGGRSKRRVALSSDYKGHRLDAPDAVEELKTDVFSLAKEFCSLAGIHHVERPGYEADDLIAHYWRQRNPGERTVIVSSDKDFLQLVEGTTEQVRLSSAGTPTDRWTEQRVMEDLGSPPAMLPYAMALAGDASDNVIGVPRFGMKTATKTLKKTIAKMIEERDEGEWWERTLADPKIAPHADRVRVNLELVDLRHRYDNELHLPPVPLWQPTTPGSLLFEPLVSFFAKHQMKSIQSRFLGGTLWK